MALSSVTIYTICRNSFNNNRPRESHACESLVVGNEFIPRSLSCVLRLNSREVTNEAEKNFGEW